VTDFLLSWMSHLIQRPGVKMCSDNLAELFLFAQVMTGSRKSEVICYLPFPISNMKAL
jgi:hypothetical protein